MNRYKVMNECEGYIKSKYSWIMQRLEETQSDIDSVFADLDVPEDEQCIDVRLNLQVDENNLPETLRFKTGDASFDQDHRGYWSAGIVSKGVNLNDVAYDLIRDVMNHLAQSI